VARRAFPPPATMTVRRTVGPAVALPSVAVIVGQVSGADLKTLAGDTGWPMFVVHPVSEMSVKAHLKCSQPSRTICCGRQCRDWVVVLARTIVACGTTGVEDGSLSERDGVLSDGSAVLLPDRSDPHLRSCG